MKNIFSLCLLSALVVGCNGGGGGTTVAVDTSPIGVGLAAIAAAMLLAAFVGGGE